MPSHARHAQRGPQCEQQSKNNVPVLDFFEQLRAAGPAQVSAPPRVWTALRSQCNVEIEAIMRESSTFTGVSGCGSQLRLLHSDRRACVEAAIKHRYAHILGPRLQGVSTGGAKTPEKTMQWLKEVFRHTGRVNEGYGSTEVGAIAQNGTLSSGVLLKLEDCPDMGYTSQVFPQIRHEIEVRGV